MKSKKLIVLIAVAALVALAIVGATLALFTDKKEVTNVVTMGNVMIELTEPAFDYGDNTISDVVPRQEIGKDPTIENVGINDAYIRAKITYEGLTTAQAAELEALLDINLAGGWAKAADGYYYYWDVLEPGEDTTLFTTVTIPDWGNEISNATFKIIVSAEAVQSDYFNVEKNSYGYIYEWESVTIEEASSVTP